MGTRHGNRINSRRGSTVRPRASSFPISVPIRGFGFHDVLASDLIPVHDTIIRTLRFPQKDAPGTGVRAENANGLSLANQGREGKGGNEIFDVVE